MLLFWEIFTGNEDFQIIIYVSSFSEFSFNVLTAPYVRVPHPLIQSNQQTHSVYVRINSNELGNSERRTNRDRESKLKIIQPTVDFLITIKTQDNILEQFTPHTSYCTCSSVCKK